MRLPVAAAARNYPERVPEPIRTVRLGPDLRICLDLREGIDRAIYLYGSYEPDSVSAFLSLIDPGDVVLDIGSHIGQYALLAAQRAGVVLAFEPNPETRDRLRANVDLNGLSARIQVLPFALSNHTGEAELWRSDDPYNVGGASLLGQASVTAAETVECRLLDEFLASRTDLQPRVKVMKVDVEGFELAVFEGAALLLSEVRPAIMFEVNGLRPRRGGAASESMDHLRSLRYELFSIHRTLSGSPRLRIVATTDDPSTRRVKGSPLNLLALHPAGVRPSRSLGVVR
jgi:FkbM family methyltransferase